MQLPPLPFPSDPNHPCNITPAAWDKLAAVAVDLAGHLTGRLSVPLPAGADKAMSGRYAADDSRLVGLTALAAGPIAMGPWAWADAARYPTAHYAPVIVCQTTGVALVVGSDAGRCRVRADLPRPPQTPEAPAGNRFLPDLLAWDVKEASGLGYGARNWNAGTATASLEPEPARVGRALASAVLRRVLPLAYPATVACLAADRAAAAVADGWPAKLALVAPHITPTGARRLAEGCLGRNGYRGDLKLERETVPALAGRTGLSAALAFGYPGNGVTLTVTVAPDRLADVIAALAGAFPRETTPSKPHGCPVAAV